MIKLNVGCGPCILLGYDNLDLYVDAPGAIRVDVRKLPYPDKSVDEVLASDILEHFPRLEWRAVLAEWVRVLKPGGLLVIQAPDMVALCEKLIESDDEAEWDQWVRRIFGGQGDGKSDPNKSMFHFNAFRPEHLTKHCIDVLGLEHVEHSRHNYNFKLVMKRKP